MATSKTTGLHRIAHAEKKAAKIITDARQRKTKRLRQAKEEANKMVNVLNKDREEKFITFEKEYNESSNDIANKINEDTKNTLAKMEVEFEEKKEAVIQELIKKVLLDINPKFHRNLRTDQLEA